MFCTTCGHALQPEATYCVGCGTPVAAGISEEQPRIFPTSYVEPPNRDNDAKKRTIAIGAGVVGVAILVVVVLVLVLGGGSSPDATVRGIFADITSGDTAGACSYVVPSSQAACNSSTSFSAVPSGVSYNMNTTSVIQGNQAIVFVVGRACKNEICNSFGNQSDPTQGMNANFSTAFSNALAGMSSGSSSISAGIPCVNINGHWYIDAPSSSFGGQG